MAKSGSKALACLGIAFIIGCGFAIVMFVFERLAIAPYLALLQQSWMTPDEAVIIFVGILIVFIWIVLLILSAIFSSGKNKKEKKAGDKHKKH
jgi:uncharacterized membrane protein